MIDLLCKIAEEDKRIRAAYIHGSRANPASLTDKYSDYDIVYVVTEIGSFINDKEWLNNFGNISYVFEAHRNHNMFDMKEVNDLSRRYVWFIMFEDGNRIDLMIEIIDEAMNHEHVKDKPVIVLLDKDGCLPVITPPSDKSKYIMKPHEDKYTALCSRFWCFLTDVAKGINRDQLAFAKRQFHTHALLTINQMLEWYAGVQSDFTVSMGRYGKDFKKYLPADIYDLYTKIYSDSDYKNFWNAIFITCELFNKTASSVGDYFSFNYNKQEEKSIMDYLIKMRMENECGKQ